MLTHEKLAELRRLCDSAEDHAHGNTVDDLCACIEERTELGRSVPELLDEIAHLQAELERLKREPREVPPC